MSDISNPFGYDDLHEAARAEQPDAEAIAADAEHAAWSAALGAVSPLDPETGDQTEAAAGADGTASGFDPADPGAATVDVVNAYIADHPDEADAIIAAERDGKARKGIIGDDD